MTTFNKGDPVLIKGTIYHRGDEGSLVRRPDGFCEGVFNRYNQYTQSVIYLEGGWCFSLIRGAIYRLHTPCDYHPDQTGDRDDDV